MSTDTIAQVEITVGPETVRLSGGKKFRLREGEALVGPSWVKPEYRGQGIYPALLKQILRPYKIAYVVTEKYNRAAQQAFREIGFLPWKEYRVINLFGFRVRVGPEDVPAQTSLEGHLWRSQEAWGPVTGFLLRCLMWTLKMRRILKGGKP